MWEKALCSTIHGRDCAHGCSDDDAHRLPLQRTTGVPVAARITAPCVIAGHYARVFDVAFSPADSSLLASASDDDTCKVWRVSNTGATQAASFHGHQDSVLRVSWAPAGSLLASGVLLPGPSYCPLSTQTTLSTGVRVCIMRYKLSARTAKHYRLHKIYKKQKVRTTVLNHSTKRTGRRLMNALTLHDVHVQRPQTPLYVCGTLMTLKQIQACLASGLRSFAAWR